MVRLVRRTEEEKYGTVRYGHLGITATPNLSIYSLANVISRLM